MRVNVTFRNVSASEALRDFAEEKVQRLTKLLIKPIDADVVLSQEGHRNHAEVHIRASGEVFTAAESSEADMYSAIDRMVSKLAVQARRHKDRARSHKARPLSGTLGRKEAEVSRQRAEDLDAELDALGE